MINDSRVLAGLSRLAGVDLPPAPGSDLARELYPSRAGWRRYLVQGPRIFVIWYRWRRDRTLHRAEQGV